ncbi:hypothetical protein A3A46_03520 [Candidatus Roizmanbacteria bacterium RIFCSPLOWO2_01_FULL_37_13]|nr:MAG: hypothetical protein A3A46_03520 [Candidatus Roizmanbacteria bacterium RIFCSPLOWO2_01_FULL_37_13]
MKKLTVTVGIPAFNEERNIGYLLDSILKQKQISYKLEKIIVVIDGCTDNTALIVKNFSQKYPLIAQINFKNRRGKAVVLNKIYKVSFSDFLLTFDADIVLEREIEIELMVKEMLKDERTNLVGGRFIPVQQDTLMGKFSVISFLIIEDAFLKLNKGNNYYALVGGASLMRKSLYKSFKYPKGTISDQNYLFATATKDGLKHFKLAKKTRIFIRTVSTFSDWRILGARSVVEDKASITRFFGKDILKNYSMPKKIYLTSILKWFIKSPFYTLGSIFMNLVIRLFPYKKAIVKEGMWELATSSKTGIIR